MKLDEIARKQQSRDWFGKGDYEMAFVPCDINGNPIGTRDAKDPKSNYYMAGDIETLDIIKAKLTPEQYEGYLLGNALKYGCRLNFKYDDPMWDMVKFSNHARWLKEFREENK